jgi:hypothetical protein
MSNQRYLQETIAAQIVAAQDKLKLIIELTEQRSDIDTDA